MSDFDQATDQIPAKIEAERAVLGALLLNDDMVDDISSVVTPEDFYSPQHRALFTALLDIHAKNLPLDLVMIEDYLSRAGTLEDAGGIGYIASLEQYCVTSSSAPVHAKRIAELATLRRLIKTASVIMREAREQSDADGTPLEASTIVERASQAIFTLGDSSKGRSEASSTIAEAIGQVIDRIELIRAGKKDGLGVMTYQPDLDYILGGLRPGGLYILAARPGIGKSSLGLQIALSVARGADVRQPAIYNRGLPVMLFSLEMSAVELGTRAVSALTKIDSSRIAQGKIDLAQIEQVGRAHAHIASVPLRLFDGSATIPRIRSIVRRLKSKNPNYCLVIVDYVQLVRTIRVKGVHQSRAELVGEMSHDLKQIAMDYGIAVMAVSALNRNMESDKRKPMLSDLRESGDLEQDADVVIFIHREFPGGSVNGKQKSPLRDGGEDQQTGPPKYSIIIGKNRHGAMGEFPIDFDAQTTTFLPMVRR